MPTLIGGPLVTGGVVLPSLPVGVVFSRSAAQTKDRTASTDHRQRRKARNACRPDRGSTGGLATSPTSAGARSPELDGIFSAPDWLWFALAKAMARLPAS